jgi:diguanylate cyclase (GGDEF)-like protein
VTEGEIVADARHKGGRLYIVLRGALSVMHADAMSAGERATAKVLPGECVGELSVLDESGGSDSMCALEESTLLVIDAERLWRLIDESNGVARNLLRLLSFRVRAANAQLRRRHKVGEFYRQLSMVDGLTNLYNRAWLDENLQAMVNAAHAAGEPLSVIMIDIDRFKQFNDEHGHQCGDEALRAAAKTIAGALRPFDCAARYGGEELIVLLPATNLDAAAMVAQRLCEQLRESVVFADMRKPLPHMTASFGVAALTAGQDAQALVACADAALYRAKEAGRDRVAG